MNILANIAPGNILLRVYTAVLLSLAGVAGAAAQVLVPSGSFHSVLPEVKGEPVTVDSFYMDSTAVTNRQFAEFLGENEQWRPEKIPAVFANQRYLSHWELPTPEYKGNNPGSPVTHVSWYAAQAYCQWAGGRLPTLNEWEYSAQLVEFASPAEARAFANRLMSWYSSVDTRNTAAVGSTGIVNRYGVRDQFGLIMEWVQDFKPVVADNLSLDCGTVGRMQQLGDAYSYAASVRYITRMSFNPQSATATMGFRCAYDVKENPKTKVRSR
ncbi:formylglycine-generating enzyme family protein [Halalkalibaculum sp. DA3122]|uniref:formylglycine-generating enzyme family protein n=1 Tax=unclassified Halalkalibaculum TaxID=2964617 RepID=UPI0037551692